MAMGFSFQPGADMAAHGAPNGAAGRSVAPPSSSVKVLSFRMPKQDVRGQVAPSALLNAQGGAGAGGLSPQLLSLLLSAFSAGPQGLGQASGPFDLGSSDPAGVVGPGLGNRSLTPRFTIGEGSDGPFRLDEDLGPGIASGGDMFGSEPVGRGFATSRRGTDAPTSNVGTGPRYPMEYQSLDDSLSLPNGQPFDRGMGRMFL